MSTTQNGTTAKTQPQVNNGKETETPVKVATPKATAPKEEGKRLSIEQRLAKFMELNKTLDKRTLVVDAIQKLEDFYIAPTGGAVLKFTDSDNNTFSITNASVIQEMVKLALDKLGAELAKLDEAFDF